MKVPFTGGCACGAIRYECTAEPIMMLKYHCRDCRHITGAGFAAAVLLSAKAFRFTKGDLTYHFTTSLAGGEHRRGFCGNCGSRISGAEKHNEPLGVIGILAGSLDDPSWFRPQMDIFTSEAQPWDQMDPAIPKYEKYPPMA